MADTWISLGGAIGSGDVTSVAVTLDGSGKPILAWADSGFRSARPSAGDALSIESLLSRLRDVHPEVEATGFTVRADPDAPVTVTSGQRTLFVDRYSGALLGESSRTGVRLRDG